MKAPSPADLSIFLSIAQHLNLSRAAIDLGLTPSALSHSLRVLENRLGVRLFNRTTRSVALTEAGDRLYTRLRPAFRDIDDALEDLNSFRDKPSGSLRITASRQACELVLLPIISPFLQQYPDIRLEIVESDAFVDVVAEGFDAGVRFSNRLDADMVSLEIGPNLRSVVVGSPKFSSFTVSHKNLKICSVFPAFAIDFPVGQFIAGNSSVGITKKLKLTAHLP